MASNTVTTAPVRRACDRYVYLMANSESTTTKPNISCHRRKIKCVSGDADGCQGCKVTGLACTYYSIPRKKGPKAKGAKVLTALHVEQRNTSSGSGPLQAAKHSSSMHRNLRTPDLLKPATLRQCIGFFFTSIYPIQPVVHPRHIHEAIADMDMLADACSLIIAFCAYSMLQRSLSALLSALREFI
jgi:hypothetical protein